MSKFTTVTKLRDIERRLRAAAKALVAINPGKSSEDLVFIGGAAVRVGDLRMVAKAHALLLAEIQRRTAR